MSKRKIGEIIKFLVDRVEEKGIPVTAAVVFGSQAKGTARDDSDIDVIIVSEAFRGMNIFKRVELVNEAHMRTIEEFVVPLDIMMKTPEEAGLDIAGSVKNKIIFAA